MNCKREELLLPLKKIDLKNIILEKSKSHPLNGWLLLTDPVLSFLKDKKAMIFSTAAAIYR